MPRNVLLIVIDQFRADCLDGALAGALDLPNLRAFQKSGVTFRRHYTVTTPCGPSRASLLTGLYAMNHRSIRNGTPLAEHHPTIGTEFRKAGYEPLLYGYTDASPDPRVRHPNDPDLKTYEGVAQGFAEIVRMRQESAGPWRGYLKAKGYALPADFFDMFRGVPRDGRNEPEITDPALYRAEDSDTAFLTDRALEDLSSREGTPWFALLTYIRPHPPMVAPEPYNTLYAPDAMPAPDCPLPPDAQMDMHPFFRAFHAEPSNKHLFIGFDGDHAKLTDRQIAELRAVYFGLATEVDAHIGRVLAWLEESGQADDTLVVITADHGEMLGDHYLWGKNAPYEGALNIPLVIRDPSRRAAAGTVVEAFTESVDIAPTLLDWIGQPAPPGWNGRSLLPFLEGQTPAHWRGHMFAEIDIGDPVGPTRFERVFGVPAEAANYAILSDGTHKYVHFNGGIAPLLFDVRHGAEGEDLAGGLKHMAELLHYSRLMLDHRMTHAHQSHARLMITDDGIRP